MDEKVIVRVEMTQQEYDKYQADKAAKEAAAKAKEDRASYAKMVDDEIATAMPILEGLSEDITVVKAKTLENFKAVLDMKTDVLKRIKENQKSHTFTHSDGKRRITIGCHCRAGWRDTVNDGVEIVKEECLALIKDDTTRAIVNQMMRLLSPDKAGNLRPTKAMQLRQLADELNIQRLNEGVTIIEESLIPTFSTTYICAEQKDNNGVWRQIPLGMTEAKL